MTHDNYICDMCDIYIKCDTHDICHTVTQCKTQAHIEKKIKKNRQLWNFNRCDTP
jgi:hypothetical protein